MPNPVVTTPDLGEKLQSVLTAAAILPPIVEASISVSQAARITAFSYKPINPEVKKFPEKEVVSDIDAAVFNVLAACELTPYVEKFECRIEGTRLRVVLYIAKSGPDLSRESLHKNIFKDG